MSNRFEVYMNRAQQEALMVNAHTEIIIASRRMGKSFGIVAPRMVRNAQFMPGSTGAFVASSFRQAHSRTLPAAMAGLESLGFKKDIHFVLGRRPPKKLGYPRPVIEPNDFSDVLSFYTGAIMTIISQDVKLSSNSMTLDWIVGDEAKGLNFDKLKDETFPANGGTQRYFGSCPWHHAMLFCSDMPVSKEGSWLFNYEDKFSPELIDTILELVALRYRYKDKEDPWAVQQRREIDALLGELRRKAVYYREWSIFENIDIVGLEYVQQMKRDLPPLVFQTSILCRRIRSIQGGFYPAFKESVHTYIANNNKELLNAGWKEVENSCLLDGDLDRNAPIAVAFDYNANINWLVAGQVKGGKITVIKSFYVKYNRKLRELIDDFCHYYRHHKRKHVVYYYDSTATGSNYAVSRDDFASAVFEQFNKNGWQVSKKYIGNPMKHHEKYQILNDAFNGAKYLIPLLNRENNDALIVSISLADVAITSRGFQKEKGGEKLAESEENLLEYRTDGSDAFDTLVLGCSLFPYQTSVYMGSATG